MNAELSLLIERELPAAQAGDRGAFGRLVAATQRLVTTVALALVRDLPTSEDIAQETYLKAWTRLDQLRNPAAFLPWLRELTRNGALDHLRQLKHREVSVDPAGDDLNLHADVQAGPAQWLNQHQQAQLLANALDQVPAECREVLLLFYREAHSSRELAQLLDLSEVAVRKRLQRARESLQARVLEQLGEVLVTSAPGFGFTAAVTAALGASPGTASAAIGSVAAFGKAAPKVVLGAFGALAASLTVMLGAVAFEVRGDLKRAPGPVARKALLRQGLVYALLMAGYMVVLWWAVQHGWSRSQTLVAGLLFSAGIVLLALRKRRLLRAGNEPPGV